ncbi:MAG TPA: hypothetical protein VK054_12345, partial [Beutenbergiaceae bacterium]|nr:hypothetical protein [Beutenbergiaceae bacterium]
ASRQTLAELQEAHDRHNTPYVPTKMQNEIDKIIGHDDFSQFVLDGAKGEDYVDVVTIVEDSQGMKVRKFTRDPDGVLTHYEV